MEAILFIFCESQIVVLGLETDGCGIFELNERVLVVQSDESIDKRIDFILDLGRFLLIRVDDFVFGLFNQFVCARNMLRSLRFVLERNEILENRLIRFEV